MSRVVVKSPREMEKFAAAVAKSLRGGEVLALTGELGAGKTAFAKGLAKALGVASEVQSPTFLVMKCHAGKRLKLCHVDAYRVKDERELYNVGLQEHLAEPSTVTVIEWADLVPGIIPAGALRMKFSHGTGENERVVSLASSNG